MSAALPTAGKITGIRVYNHNSHVRFNADLNEQQKIVWDSQPQGNRGDHFEIAFYAKNVGRNGTITATLRNRTNGSDSVWKTVTQYTELGGGLGLVYPDTKNGLNTSTSLECRCSAGTSEFFTINIAGSTPTPDPTPTPAPEPTPTPQPTPNPTEGANGIVTAIRVRDIHAQKWYEWNRSTAWSAPIACANGKSLYIAAQATNTGTTGKFTLRLSINNSPVKDSTLTVGNGGTVGLEWTGTMAASGNLEFKVEVLGVEAVVAGISGYPVQSPPTPSPEPDPNNPPSTPDQDKTVLIIAVVAVAAALLGFALFMWRRR